MIIDNGPLPTVQTLLWSLPAVFNVGTVLLLFMFVYAIMGMNLFGTNIYGASGNGITRHSNFQTFLSSMNLMFRLITGSNWDIVMEVRHALTIILVD